MSVALDRLLGRLADEKRLLTGYSGGADSPLLAYAAHQVLGSRAIAVTAVSAIRPARERRSARDFAREHRMAQSRSVPTNSIETSTSPTLTTAAFTVSSHSSTSSVRLRR
jgi:PP-loop superfamily ATP-utilizing enzyme